MLLNFALLAPVTISRTQANRPYLAHSAARAPGLRR